MYDVLKLEVVTPRKEVISEEVASVILPGRLGEMAVLPNHRPLLTSLRPGRLRVQPQGGSMRTYYLAGGFAEVLGGRVVLLADECIPQKDVDLEKAREQLKKAETTLEEKRHEGYAETRAERLELARAQAMIDVGSKATE